MKIFETRRYLLTADLHTAYKTRNGKIHPVRADEEFPFQVKLLRSIRKLVPGDVILGQYKATHGDEVDVKTTNLTPTYFAAALFIDNARWDGVPFMIRTGMGLIKHRSATHESILGSNY